MGERNISIGVCAEADRRAALGLVLRSLPADQRGPLVESLGRLQGEPLGAFAALVVARQADRVVGATWAQPQPGRTASLWLPEVDGVRADRVSGPLIREAMQRADAAGVRLSQVLLESPQDPATPDLQANGFTLLTTLHYLQWLGDSPKSTPAAESCGVEFVAAESIGRTQLETLVGQTYTDTLDCPELDGMRSIADVLSGYEQTGDHDPALWFVLRQADEPAGVLLLNEHRSSRQVELTYMGVVPSARGRGIGAAAVTAAQKEAARLKADRLVLAVDDRNLPARKVYQHAGFKPWATRTVYIRPAP
ncbi:MAG: GNAT family N-acetyltransferase [Planctomycetota bacterium]